MDLFLAKGQVAEPGGWRKPGDPGVDSRGGASRRSSDQVELREGFDRQPASRGVGSGARFDVKSVFEVQRLEPPSGGAGREGQGGAGCRREGARARRVVRSTPGRVWGTALAVGARERLETRVSWTVA